jgi:CBS domain-containing protein
MSQHFETYQHLYEQRLMLFSHVEDHETLNTYHDLIIHEAVQLSIRKLSQQGKQAPVPFSFFMMGSAGRKEQGFLSDQDHGYIFKTTPPETTYFSELGEEITQGLDQVGYKLCDGRVMCTNPLWAHSESDWIKQLEKWIEADEWTDIRHLLIFMDGRVLVGDKEVMPRLQQSVFDRLKDSTYLLKRMMENTARLKKAVGLFGNFLTEQHGTYSGSINLKDTAFFPFVNSVRLYTILEKITATSTLERFDTLAKKEAYKDFLPHYKLQYEKLLKLRFKWQQDLKHFSYDDGHYIKPDFLSQSDRQELKTILEAGEQLFHLCQRQIKKRMT